VSTRSWSAKRATVPTSASTLLPSLPVVIRSPGMYARAMNSVISGRVANSTAVRPLAMYSSAQ
jgi:hypothetical protein